jgi:hypothetical protein
MRILKSLTLAATALLTLMILAPSTPAQAQGPRYLHALSNLRMARAWIQSDGRPQFSDIRKHAVHEIDKAIDEVKKAARDDGKYTNWTPPPSSGGNPATPITSALTLLDEAHGDVGAGQDAPENMGLQVRALQHIDAARQDLQEIRRIVAGQ